MICERRVTAPSGPSEGVGRLNWGLVTGKTQTNFAWDSPRGSGEPDELFHDIFCANHTPYRVEEANSIRRICLGDDGERQALG